MFTSLLSQVGNHLAAITSSTSQPNIRTSIRGHTMRATQGLKYRLLLPTEFLQERTSQTVARLLLFSKLSCILSGTFYDSSN